LVARGRYGGNVARRALPVLRRFSAQCPTTFGAAIPYASSSVDFASSTDAPTVTSPLSNKQLVAPFNLKDYESNA
jgi:hypothetical protein